MQNNDKPICLLFGANGQVGFELCRSLSLDYNVVALARQQCDFSDAGQIRQAIQSCKPSVIVNAAAYTAVDKAEEEPDLAHAVNVSALEVIADQAKKIGAAIVHYSTVFVFDGTSKVPYCETDEPNPINIYAQSKLKGEQVLIKELGADYPLWILRASWVYGIHGNNFLKQILALACSRDSLSVVSDEMGAPISASLIADLTGQLLQVQPKPGIYHISSAGQTNRFNYAKLIIEHAFRLGLPVKVAASDIVPVSSDFFNAPAKRPKNTLMDYTKLSDALSINVPDWSLGVQEAVSIIVERKMK